MSKGLLGKAMSSNTGPVIVYTVPNSPVEYAVITINLSNTGQEDAAVKISFSSTDTPGLMDQLEPNAIIPSNGGSLQRSCELVSPGERIIIECDKNTVAIRVTGLEQIPPV